MRNGRLAPPHLPRCAPSRTAARQHSIAGRFPTAQPAPNQTHALSHAHTLILEAVSAGRDSTSGGKSHSWLRPISCRSSGLAQYAATSLMTSVAEGSSDTHRIAAAGCWVYAWSKGWVVWGARSGRAARQPRQRRQPPQIVGAAFNRWMRTSHRKSHTKRNKQLQGAAATRLRRSGCVQSAAAATRVAAVL